MSKCWRGGVASWDRYLGNFAWVVATRSHVSPGFLTQHGFLRPLLRQNWGISLTSQLRKAKEAHDFLHSPLEQFWTRKQLGQMRQCPLAPGPCAILYPRAGMPLSVRCIHSSPSCSKTHAQLACIWEMCFFREQGPTRRFPSPYISLSLLNLSGWIVSFGQKISKPKIV